MFNFIPANRCRILYSVRLGWHCYWELQGDRKRRIACKCLALQTVFQTQFRHIAKLRRLLPEFKAKL